MSDHSSGTTIARRLKQPTRESSGTNRAAVNVSEESPRHSRCSLLGFAPSGVYRARSVTRSAVRSYRTVSPLPESREPRIQSREALTAASSRSRHPKALDARFSTLNSLGGLFSVALSLSSRTVGVTHHSVLRSPDFPLQTAVAPASRARPQIRSDRLAHFGERECSRTTP